MMFQAWIHPRGEAKPRPLGVPKRFRGGARLLLENWEGRAPGARVLTWQRVPGSDGYIARDGLGKYLVYPEGITPPDSTAGDVIGRMDTDHYAPRRLPTAADEWRKLYRWLGEQASIAFAEAQANEASASLDANVGRYGMGEGFLAARARMRRADRSLPYSQRIDRGEYPPQYRGGHDGTARRAR